jgi:CRISPR-associated protein Cmr5
VSTRTLDQQRAQHAWKQVEKARALDDRKRKDFGREAKKLPVRIINSGLGAALLFLWAKDDRAPGLREALKEWLHERIKPAGTAAPKDVLERIREGDARFLRLATAESLAYLQWLVRLAEGAKLVPDVAEEE